VELAPLAARGSRAPGWAIGRGGSILMTSAPNSANIFPANGPAMSWPQLDDF